MKTYHFKKERKDMATGITTRVIDVIVIKRIDRATITCELMTINDTLSTYYDIIGCRCIDIVQRSFGGLGFDIVLDDEGLLKANETGELPTSWWQGEGYTPNYEGLFGVLVLTHHDDQGNLTSVSPMELIAVQSASKIIPTKDGVLGLLFHDLP